ncbi:MAG: hypothetical protein ACE5I5_12720 [Candidatus Heimdallarchaeota archaeon]
MSKPTEADAELLLQIFAIMRTDEDARKATWWVFEELEEQSYDEFKAKYPMGSEGNRNFKTFASYCEVIGTLVNKNLLSEDIVFDAWGNLLWDKLKPIVLGMRKDMGIPRLMENYEIFANKYPKWEEKNPPKV